MQLAGKPFEWLSITVDLLLINVTCTSKNLYCTINMKTVSINFGCRLSVSARLTNAARKV